MPTSFDELDVNAIVTESFSDLHFKACVPYLAYQHKELAAWQREIEMLDRFMSSFLFNPTNVGR